MKFTIPSAFRWVAMSLVVVAGMAMSGNALAANYSLELVSPRAAGTSPISGAPAIGAGNRIFKAYPGIEYNIRAVVIGGAYPYTFSLSGAPAGMTIDARTGEIRWPNATGTSVTPTITVTDSEGTVRSSPWTIAVTTAGFKFVDAANGSALGTGAIGSPFRTISDLYTNTNSNNTDMVYFRNGTYNALNLPRASVGSPWERVEVEGRMSNIWIAYPGESPVIDFGFLLNVDPGVILRFQQTNAYLDGFETRNSRIIGFQVLVGNYGVFRRMRMRDHNLIRANLDGANASFIMCVTGGGMYGEYLAIQDNEFANAQDDMALKIYAQRKLLIEGNRFRDMSIATELKADMPQFTYRGNTHTNISRNAIAGNMHDTPTSGEINFNVVTSAGQFAVDLNQDGMAGKIDVYRNTLVGRVMVRNTDAADGPFNFYNNVIINNDPGTHLYLESVSAPDRITTLNNLVGNTGSGIVDANGTLTANYAQYVGSRGHQVGVVPRPPTGVTVQ
jgi:hypothetical protein